MKFSFMRVLPLAVAIYLGVILPGGVIQNLSRVRIAKAWMALKPENAIYADVLQDGIPDAWFYYAWGESTQIYQLDQRAALAGRYAVSIERTNSQGGATLAQDFAVQPDTRLVVTVYAKGDGGATHIWLRDATTLAWMKEGWQRIVPSGTWQQYSLLVEVPSSVREVRLLLQAEGLTFFDEVYVGLDSSGHLGPNLVENPGFEQDGISQDPLMWWEDHIVAHTPMIILEGRVLEGLSYMNIADMLAGRYDVIKQRALELSDDCVAMPDMTSWLIARGDDFELAGGVAARERLYQLAIELAPNCPQPYAALAELYQSHQGFGRAAALFYQAAERAQGSVLAGKYYFDEGFVHVRYTGDIERAIYALQAAERIEGWEGGAWYWGAASFLLGQAYEQAGHPIGARQAYQHVLDCSRCTYYHSSALQRLTVLSAKSGER